MIRRNFLKVSSLSGICAINGLSEQPLAFLEEGYITEQKRKIPIAGNYDVIVSGAGPAGIAAALSASRNGAKTLLIEVNGCLGGVWTAGLLTWLLDIENKKGIMAEIVKKVDQMKTAEEKGSFYSSYSFDPEKMKLLLEQLTTEAGIDILLHTRVCSCVKAGKKISHIITESKSGREAYGAKIFIDCTGDGDLAAQAGCEFSLGRDKDGALQPFSQLVLLTGINIKDISEFVHPPSNWTPEKGWPGTDSQNRLRFELFTKKVIPSYRQITLFYITDNLLMMMGNHEYNVSPLNNRHVTKATINARIENHKIINALRDLGKGWEKIRIVATAEQIGTREGRRIKGLYTITESDLARGARFVDGICEVSFPIDVHSPTSTEGGGVLGATIKSKPYEIPLRALISRDFDNLMMAGRNISGDFIAHASYRVTGNAVIMGEAAGFASALCLHQKVTPANLNLKEFRSLWDKV